MRKILVLAMAATLLFSLAACGEKTPVPAPTTTAEPTTAPGPAAPGEYSYVIRPTYDSSPPGVGNPLFQFTRPFFQATSELANAANDVYSKMEAEFTAKMEEAKAGYGNEPGSKDYIYTELTERSYEKDGVVSFVTKSEWFMGGVSNAWITGHTFDFNLGRELKIADVLHGDDAEIAQALESRFYAWYAGEGEDPAQLADFERTGIAEQSGPDANFYLAGDGVHVFFEPYTVPATQSGIDILIPWGDELVKFAG